MSTLDVIVPCYGYGHFLRQCVESALAQSGPSVRVLIIDDGSSDNTAQIARQLVESDARVSLIVHENNRGHIATYNEGLDWVSADYLLILSADDYVLPGAFARATELMDADPGTTFSFGAATMLESDTGKTRTGASLPVSTNRVLSGAQFIAESGGNNIVFTPTAIVRTSSQKQAGGYLSRFPHCADMELWFRLAALGRVAYITTPQAVYRRHSANMSSTYIGGYLPDLVERKAVLDHFFSEYRQAAQHELYRRAKYSLACSAIAFASAAYEDGKTEAFRELVQFARSTSPAWWASIPFCKFTLKRAVGLHTTRALRSMLGRRKAAFI